MVKSSLATLLVWYPPGTAFGPWHCINMAKVDFKEPAGYWIGQISLNLIKFVAEIHEKMRHLSMLKGSFATLMVWHSPGTAYGPCYCIKLAKFNFRGHIWFWIGQIFLHWKSPKWFFEIFSVPKGQCQQLWPFSSCHRKWTIEWNPKIDISLVLEHLDWPFCENHIFFWKIQKTHFFHNKHMI